MSKKSAKAKDEISYDVRDIVLAKIRGFPAWPAMIVDPDNIPKEVAKERPLGKKQIFYCVRFFPAGDHSWVLSKDLSKLKRHEIEAYVADPHKKNAELLTGYQIALDPEKWEKDREQMMIDAEEAEADEEVDELDGEEEADDDDEKPKTKKRKRVSEPGAKAKSKPKKEKDNGDISAKKKRMSEKADKPAKTKKNGAKSKTMVESEDDGEHAESAGPSKKTSPPPAKKIKRDKDDTVDPETVDDPDAIMVKDWRHTLQKAFLGKSIPKDEEMQRFNDVLVQVEEFDMTVKCLQFSKIGKVMRHIAALESEKVPGDAEFKFKDRAQVLVNKWQAVISKDRPNGTAASAETKMEVDKPVNGDAAHSKAPVEEKSGEEPAADHADTTMDLGAGDLTMLTEVA